MGAAVDIEELKAARLRNLVTQLGLSRVEAAKLLRELAHDFDPQEQYRRLRSAAERIQTRRPVNRRQAKDSTATERQRRSRRHRAAGLRILRAYPAVSDEHIATLVRAGLIPLEAAEHDAELVDALVNLVHQIAESAR